MGTSDYVNVTISTTAPGVSRKGFGVPLFACFHTVFPELVRTYSEASELLTDGFTTSSAAYKWASTLKAQSPSPSTFKIGRRTRTPTQTLTLTVVNTTQGFTHAFGIEIGGAVSPISRTNGAAETATAIATAIAALVNALTGVAATATNAVITVTHETVGQRFDYVAPITRAGRDGLTQIATTADSGLALDLTAIYEADPDFYAFGTDGHSKAEITAAAGWAATNVGNLCYFPDTADSDCGTNSTTDTISALKALAYRNTVIPLFKEDRLFHYYSAALMGHILPGNPGEIVATHHLLSGLVPDPLSATQITNLTAKLATYYVNVGGSGQVEGPHGPKTCYGEWLDVQTGQDWMIADIRANAQDKWRTGSRIPFTDSGIATLGSAVQETLTKGESYLVNPGWSLTLPKASGFSSSQKNLRKITGVTFQATWQGAATSVGIVGTVTA